MCLVSARIPLKLVLKVVIFYWSKRFYRISFFYSTKSILVKLKVATKNLVATFNV
jgi:hypothetical protein